MESPANGLLRLEPIGLRKDAGYVGTESSFTDGITVNPSIAGRVAGVFGTAKSTRVEFDHGTDGGPEGFVKSDATHRTFVYDPRFTDPSFETRTGNITIRYRLIAIDDAGIEMIVLDWTPFSYVLQGAPTSDYTVDSLAESWGVGGYEHVFGTAEKRVNATGTFWGDSATEILDRENSNADERRDLRDQLADLVHTRANTSTDDGTIYSEEVSIAWNEYDQTMVDVQYNATYNTEVSYGTIIGVSNSLSSAIRAAAYTLYVANVNTNDSWVTQSSTIQEAYQTNLESATKAATDSLAGDNKEYHKTTAQIDHDFVIEKSRLEGVRANAQGTSNVTYVQTVAPADQARPDLETSLEGTRNVQDANALKAYRVGEATNYASAMTAWNGAVNTPWTAMHAELSSQRPTRKVLKRHTLPLAWQPKEHSRRQHA